MAGKSSLSQDVSAGVLHAYLVGLKKHLYVNNEEAAKVLGIHRIITTSNITNLEASLTTCEMVNNQPAGMITVPLET